MNLPLVAGTMRGVIEIQVMGKSMNCAPNFGTEGRGHDQGFSVGIVLEYDELGIEVQGLLIVQVII
jgi:hypothetical protein